MTSAAYQPFFFNFKLSDLSQNGSQEPNTYMASTIFRNDINRLFDIIRPKPCPFPLRRIGGSKDGAYLIPDDLMGIEACFSPGVNCIKNFEDELSLAHQINCHMCDYSCDTGDLQTPLIKGQQTFRKKWLAAASDEKSITLDEWMETSCSSGQADLLMQMDIEGAEYKILLECDRQVLTRFRILVIEFHHLHRALYDHRILNEVCLPVLCRLARDFVCVHAHPNNYQPHGHRIPGHAASIPEFLELTFLRRDRFASAQKRKVYPVMIPHPLDITNVPANRPMFLEAEWGAGRHWRSRLKIAKEKLSSSLRG